MATAERSLQQELHTLYTEHHGWLHGWLRKKLGCAHSAADIAQDTFLRIITSRDALFGIHEPRAYLTTTAQRLLLDRDRRQRIEQAYLAELALLTENKEGSCSPEQIMAAVQALEQITAVLEGVAVKARKAFLLHYLDDIPQAEVARQLDVSERMVRKYLVQVLLHCRSVLA